MKPSAHAWDSPHVGREMKLERFGSSGVPLIYLPSSGGDHREWTRYRMTDVARPWIESGRVQVFSIDGCGPETLWNDGIDPRERIRAYARFERYAVDELLPWIADATGPLPPVLIGASYGGFVAANLLFKHAQRVAGFCGLGGVYGLWHRLDGYHDEDVYCHTPLEYLPRLEDPTILASIRATRGITLFAAENDEWLPSTRRLADVLADKKIPHRVEVWPAPADHHEKWWRLQLRRFLLFDL